MEFKPYITDLASYVNKHIDLLVVTHEHNDHVNGFDKCENIFSDKDFTIDEAWFAWTENPDDPDGRVKILKTKQEKVKKALKIAINELKIKADEFDKTDSEDFNKFAIRESQAAFLNGLNSVAEINLPAAGAKTESLAGMVKIKEILKEKKTKVSYLDPGQTVVIDKIPNFKFHILGPPSDRDHVFKDGKEGEDVYRKKFNFLDNSLAADALLSLSETDFLNKDLPFSERYIDSASLKKQSITAALQEKDETTVEDKSLVSVSNNYRDPNNNWRTIDNDWLNSAGSLALRLDSHINNTSLAMAIESEDTQKVVLFPGDAEYKNWESWHLIENWKNKTKNDKPFVEDLLNRTVFYKVGHHLSYNGTALQRGISMMQSPELAAMATLDRKRISIGWKSTMPNKLLMAELIKRCKGKFFIMDEADIVDGPSTVFPIESLQVGIYEEGPTKENLLYKQYNLAL